MFVNPWHKNCIADKKLVNNDVKCIIDTMTNHDSQRILFLYPVKLSSLPPDSAPAIRPRMLLEGLRLLKLEPILLDGSPQEILHSLRDLNMKEIKFAYGENLTIPLFLSEGKKHFLNNWHRWTRIFSILKRHGIPAGFFIRDIYWRFPHLLKRHYNTAQIAALIPAYMLEYQLYYRFAKRIYVPTLEMARYLPLHSMLREKFVPLPPGTDPDPLETTYMKGKLDLVYFGGIVNTYEMPPVFSLMKREIPGINWHFFVRKEEWKEIVERYGPFHNDRVNVYHVDRREIRKRLTSLSPVMIYFPLPGCRYNTFNRNLKIMDAISWGIPIILPEANSHAEPVKRFDAGWVIKYDEEKLKRLIVHLAENPGEIEKKKKNAEKWAEEERWERRAITIAETLSR